MNKEGGSGILRVVELMAVRSRLIHECKMGANNFRALRPECKCVPASRLARELQKGVVYERCCGKCDSRLS